MKHRGIYLKKTALAVFTLGSSIAFAGSMGPICSPGSLTTPCKQMAWTVGGKALYLLPTYSGALVYQSTFSTYTPPTPTGPYTEIDTNYNTGSPNYGWGFQVEGAYHFNKGKDVNINWYRMHSTTNTNKAFGTNKGTPNNPQALPNPQTLNPQWDAVNLELGQTIGINDTGQARLYGGVQYARINTNITFDPINTPGLFYSPITISNVFNYNGFGPRVGVDLTWGLGDLINKMKMFGLYANAATAILVGRESFKQSTPLVPIYNPAGSTFSASHTSIVPELEVKLGAKYSHLMQRGTLDLDVGWMWDNYFNALEAPFNIFQTNGGLNPVASNFGLQGLYFGLKWTGNV